MKTKLLFALSLITLGVNAQAPVASYYGTNDAVFDVVTSTPAINQTASGANLTWDFTNLSIIGQSIDTDLTPTAAELTEYPGTTTVVQTLSQVGALQGELRTYSKAPASTLSFTGIDNGGLLLNYSTNNALIGAFPLEYGYNNVDNVAGTYDNGSYAGTFTGTITTSVDAFGTLNLAGPNINVYNGPATRLKTMQTLNLNYGIFTNVGTITATTYSYYGNANQPGVPRFRTSTTTVSVPLLSINDTLSQMESYAATLLTTNLFDANADVVKIAPNPVSSTLQITSGSQQILSVRISDVTGKTVLTNPAATIDVSNLQNGVYFAAIATDAGTTVKKFIKK